MIEKLDEYDRKILKHLQHDASISMDDLADHVHLSRNACWRRVKQLEASGVIKARVALIDPNALGLGQAVLVQIRAGGHSPDWLSQFKIAVQTIPEIISAQRMSGDLDYVLRLRVTDVADYDRIYQQLIRLVPLADISASFVMEDIKDTTALPTHERY